MILFLLIFTSLLQAQPVKVDAGSDTDVNYYGGDKLVIPVIGDNTVRWSATGFYYEFGCWDVPYVVKLTFIEPTVKAIGQRVFTVRINDQIVLDRLDLFASAGFGQFKSWTFIPHCSNDLLTIRFLTQVRNSILSSLEITPLFQIFGIHKPGGELSRGMTGDMK